MKLTKYEKETIILFNEAEDQVNVFIKVRSETAAGYAGNIVELSGEKK